MGDMTFCELGEVTGMFIGDVIPGLPWGVAFGLVTGYDWGLGCPLCIE